MCGRYYRRSDKQKIAEAFHAGVPPELVVAEWDYNVAPTTFQPVIRNDKETGDRELVLMRWGLVPFFTKQLSDVKGISTINARAEGIEKARTWRVPFEKRRCIVPADGYYEWKHLDKKTKQPFAFRMRDVAPFAFAGLWDAWKDPTTGDWLQSYSLITAEANELASDVIDRMPVILHPKDYERWLERESERPPLDLLRPFESEALMKWACNPLVGSVKNNGPEMLDSPQAPLLAKL